LKLAAIDIGSNAVRCQISNVLSQDNRSIFKKIEYIRYPMRFGEDVFNSGFISNQKIEKFIQFMHALRLLLEVHEVDHYMVCATSAMREARNAPDIIQEVQEKLGITIQVIDGHAEAELINLVISNTLDEKNYLHIDVGGGSTEYNVYVNREKMATRSFEQGSIRHMQGQDSVEIWEGMKSWVKQNAKLYHISRAIGTGGNINKIFELSGKTGGKVIFKKQIEEIVEQMEAMTMDQRINMLLLNPDRADVIVPASKIYLATMKWGKIESMLVPAVGLKDGMLYSLYDQFKEDPDKATNKQTVISKFE
jgi:exopolyphosphatase / guanosine-5'-triphosphate,3'-diphosphate pyrophosphatase